MNFFSFEDCLAGKDDILARTGTKISGDLTLVLELDRRAAAPPAIHPIQYRKVHRIAIVAPMSSCKLFFIPSTFYYHHPFRIKESWPDHRTPFLRRAGRKFLCDF